jgi:hypothetical protein
MDEHDQNSENFEIAPLDNTSDESMHDQQNQNAEAVKKADEQDRNWRAMRQRQKELEIELQRRDEMLDRVLKSQPQQPVQKIEEPEIDDDEPIVAGMAKGIAKKTMQPLEKKIHDLELKLAQQEQQKQLSSLRSKYSDFDDVVNIETLELLEKQEPELAATIGQLNDQYKMALQSYKYIKALNLVESVPQARRSKEVVSKMEKNAKAVQSPQAYDKRPMAQAFKMTKADEKNLYEEMMQYASKASGL